MTYRPDNIVSLWAIGGRIKMPFICHNTKYLPYIKGEADLVFKKGKFYLFQTISAEWRQRFHANLHQDSQRLSLTAQALVAYLDSFEAEGQATTPQEEVEAWLAEPGDADPDPGDLTSDAARAMAADLLAGLLDDRDALSDRAPEPRHPDQKRSPERGRCRRPAGAS
ncbi:hypothetical protein [Klebsiella pneumoniae]|uniref:hypothetical protein n=1 Tax=Klebsiella pneumoniae TaxID=573 RepID=UPI00200D25B6|nr:hypothetical protein [Klebsiella pneumoniae]UPY99795.1 hypothetical protein MOV22_26665 [Klebsiella pneumoniae]